MKDLSRLHNVLICTGCRHSPGQPGGEEGEEEDAQSKDGSGMWAHGLGFLLWYKQGVIISHTQFK